jgi:hypothetical protein
MERELPAKEQLVAESTEGLPITQSKATAIAQAERDMTRRGPIKGGPAATAQSLHDRQQNFFEVAGEVARKPSEEVTKEDAAKVKHFEVRCQSSHYPVCLATVVGGAIVLTGKATGPGSRTCTRKGLVLGRGAGHCRAQRSEARRGSLSFDFRE